MFLSHLLRTLSFPVLIVSTSPTLLIVEIEDSIYLSFLIYLIIFYFYLFIYSISVLLIREWSMSDICWTYADNALNDWKKL